MDSPSFSRWTRRALFGVAALGGLALLFSTDDAEARRPWWRPPVEQLRVSVTLEDASGNALRTFSHRGRTFVLGELGERYVVRIANHSGGRVEAVLAVDGRDAVSGESEDAARNRGYLLEPHGSVSIEGFRTSLDSVATFRFSDRDDSYAARLGDASDVGQIRVAFFSERPRPVVRERRWNKARPKSAAPGRASRSAESSRDAQGLGTEFGEQRDSRVREVSFERADRRNPTRSVSLQYDDAEGLVARGIEVWPRRRVAWEQEQDFEQPWVPRRRWARPPPGE